MEAIRKLRDQVAKQQQAVFKQFSGGIYGGSDNVASDENEFQQHQKLEKLYISTRAAKHYQKEIVRGVEGYIVAGSRHVEIVGIHNTFSTGTKLSEDSRKYGSEKTCTSGNTLSRAALSFGRARAQMEKECGVLLKALGTQLAEPLRAMIVGAPLEYARHLAQRYARMRQEAEAQAIDVSRRQTKARDSAGNADIIMKLEAAEAKLQELQSSVAILGKEATAAMAAVEGQQQRLTLQRLLAMVEAERNYHQNVLQILDQLEGEIFSEKQRIEASPSPPTEDTMPPPPSYEDLSRSFASETYDELTELRDYFLGEVMYTFHAVTDVELSLSFGDYVVVRKVLSSFLLACFHLIFMFGFISFVLRLNFHVPRRPLRYVRQCICISTPPSALEYGFQFWVLHALAALSLCCCMHYKMDFRENTWTQN